MKARNVCGFGMANWRERRVSELLELSPVTQQWKEKAERRGGCKGTSGMVDGVDELMSKPGTRTNLVSPMKFKLQNTRPTKDRAHDEGDEGKTALKIVKTDYHGEAVL